MKTDVRQHDLSDCAAACIASIARYYGEVVPLTVIREASGTSAAGTSIKGILDACREGDAEKASTLLHDHILEARKYIPEDLD